MSFFNCHHVKNFDGRYELFNEKILHINYIVIRSKVKSGRSGMHIIMEHLKGVVTIFLTMKLKKTK